MDKSLEVKNYEHNISIFLDAKRKENDILLTSSIPTQLTNMKTLLWINFVLIGLMLQTISKFPMSQAIIGFFILSILAILTILIAMLTNKSKSYGLNDDINTMSYYPDDEWTISQATYDMICTVQKSIEHNRLMLRARSKKLSIAKFFTLCSIIFIIITFSIKQINSKEVKMSEEKKQKPTTPYIQPQPVQIQEDSVGSIRNTKPQPQSQPTKGEK